ncbi:MAG: hypothetical protein AB7S68_39860 [Polyangiaceae bacterium]
MRRVAYWSLALALVGCAAEETSGSHVGPGTGGTAGIGGEGGTAGTGGSVQQPSLGECPALVATRIPTEELFNLTAGDGFAYGFRQQELIQVDKDGTLRVIASASGTASKPLYYQGGVYWIELDINTARIRRWDEGDDQVETLSELDPTYGSPRDLLVAGGSLYFIADPAFKGSRVLFKLVDGMPQSVGSFPYDCLRFEGSPTGDVMCVDGGFQHLAPGEAKAKALSLVGTHGALHNDHLIYVSVDEEIIDVSLRNLTEKVLLTLNAEIPGARFADAGIVMNDDWVLFTTGRNSDPVRLWGLRTDGSYCAVTEDFEGPGSLSLWGETAYRVTPTGMHFIDLSAVSSPEP